MFIHCNSDEASYWSFFSNLPRLPKDASAPLMLGSDDEKAMRNAIDGKFPSSAAAICFRHVKENANAQLTKIGTSEQSRRALSNAIFGMHVLWSEADRVVLNQTVNECREIINSKAPSFMSYFDTRVVPMAKTNLEIEIKTKLPVFSVKWTNNNAESINHVAKAKVEWKPQALYQLIKHLYELVKTQEVSVERAIIGEGDFKLGSQFVNRQVSESAWIRKTPHQREADLAKFYRRTKMSTRSTISSNNQLVVKKPLNGGKNNQVKRNQATKTTTVTKKTQKMVQ